MMSSQKPNKVTDPSNHARLLRAATDAFAEHGYEGASLRSIAENAGVSFQLINYYFGSKEELWLATVDYLYERYLETGKGLGFAASGNIFEQFHSHLRLLLTDMLQRPQMRKIWIQEYFAKGDRYTKIIKPRMKNIYETLVLPYFKEVVRLGIVTKFTPEEIGLLFSSITQNNVAYPYHVELLLGLATGSPKSVETQVDLLFNLLTEQPDTETSVATKAARLSESSASISPASKDQKTAESGNDTVIYPWNNSRPDSVAGDTDRTRQLEVENRRLKRLIGNLSAQKDLLLEMLQAKDRDSWAPEPEEPDTS